MYGDRLETTVNAKVEVDAQVAVTAAATADDNIVLLRWGQILANGYLEKEIDRQVAAGKLIRVDTPPPQYRQHRSLPSPSHAPGSPIIDLVAIPPKPEPAKPLTDSHGV